MNGEPPNVMNWPIPSRVIRWIPSNDLPDALTAISSIPDPGSHGSTEEVLQEGEMKQLCEIWRQTREKYPGWVLSPKENRDRLWDYTQDWIVPIFK
jgi:hypothetical protein